MLLDVKAAVLTTPRRLEEHPLHIAEAPDPQLTAGHVLLRVRACGVCRTDLHIVEGELPPVRSGVIPGHQIVGDVVAGATDTLYPGARVGVCWLGGTDGRCLYCVQDLKTSAIRLRSPGTRWMEDTPNTRSQEAILCSRCPRRSMICKQRLCFAPA